MAAVRRSARTRQQATSIYDEAKKEIDEKLADEAEEQENDDDSQDENSSLGDKSDVESDVEAGGDAGEEPSDDESSDDDEEDFKPSAPKKSRTPSSEKKQKKPQKKTQIKVGRSTTPRKPKAAGGGGTTTRRGVQSALNALAKKVLDPAENANNSLVAALLQSHRGKAAPSPKSRLANDDGSSIYTPQLESIARRVIEEHKNDPNRAQTLLLNLLFRSVGGVVETNLDPDNTVLEDMDNEEWAKVVTDLVDEMRHTSADRILFCADPEGAVHMHAVESGKELDTSEPGPSSFGVREYRKIYEEFWYVLGSVALTEGIASNGDDDDVDSDEESTDQNRRHTMSFTTTSRFDAEVVRDLISRVTELVTVGQPDVRAAAAVAALQLGHAVLNRTVELGAKLEVATRQYESAASGKKHGPLSKKAESFRHQVDSLKRTKADLEEIVSTSLIQGVFMHRYRDSSMYIRATALKSLSRMTLQRPDLFLMDKYLKYFGWMMSDKAASVRVASLYGLHAPFLAVQEQPKSRKNPIDLQQMSNVVTKFLPKLADCVLDVNYVVQERAMALLLALEREGLLDEVMDDNLWMQINVRALSPQTTPAVRRDALYFVMDQLEAFDEDEVPDKSSSNKRGRGKDASLAQSSERMMVQRIDALASWVGDTLADGPIPIDKIRVHRADYVVDSLRAMPEHKSLVTNWHAMLRAIGDDNAATTTVGENAGDKTEVAKQRVLVQMLARAAQAEVAAVTEHDFLSKCLDPDEAGVEAEENATTTTKTKKTKGKAKSGSAGMRHEVLSVALLNALPDLLIKFKGDPTILGSLTLLPRYILPSVFSLPQRKKDFLALVKNLCDIYLESSDEYVLQNIALSLSSLSQGGHTRSADVDLQLQLVASTLSGRVIELITESEEDQAVGTKRISPKKLKRSSKRRRKNDGSESSDVSDDDDEEPDSKTNDDEYAISSCLRRLRILSKRCNLSELLDDSDADDESAVGTVEDLCNAVVTGMEKRLKKRAVHLEKLSDEEDDPDVTVPEIWKSGDQSIHEVVASSVKDSLSLLLSITAWKLCMAEKEENILMQDDDDIPMEDEEDGDVADKHGVIRHRDQLYAMLLLCFEQFLPPVGDPSEPVYSKEHIAFADEVQIHAIQIAGDLRSLFPKEWASAVNPFLRACALTDDQSAAGGLVRFVRSKEVELRTAVEGEENIDLTNNLLVPLARSVAPNWQYANRREAGVVLAHVVGSGTESGKVVSAFSRVLKKINPVRLLEAHMASLQQSYEEWQLNEPGMENDRNPSEEEMAAYEEADQKFKEEFKLLEQQAARLSQSLGVGKLSDDKLSSSLLGFVRNGIKFAFSQADDDYLGSCLSFLHILSKYASWIKKNDEQLDIVRRDLDEAEETLREHPDFDEVDDNDLAVLKTFRLALGIKPETTQRNASARSVTDDDSRSQNSDEYSDDGDSVTRTSVGTGGTRRRRSQGGASVASVRSKLSSAPGSLSPLYEEDASVEESPDEEASEPRAKRRKGKRGVSIASTLSVSTIGGQSQPTIAEGSGESGSESDVSY